MRRFALYALCGLASTCFAVAVQAQDASGTSVPAADKTFVMKAAQGGMAEVNLGKLARGESVPSGRERVRQT